MFKKFKARVAPLLAFAPALLSGSAFADTDKAVTDVNIAVYVDGQGVLNGPLTVGQNSYYQLISAVGSAVMKVQHTNGRSFAYAFEVKPHYGLSGGGYSKGYMKIFVQGQETVGLKNMVLLGPDKKPVLGQSYNCFSYQPPGALARDNYCQVLLTISPATANLVDIEELPPGMYTLQFNYQDPANPSPLAAPIVKAHYIKVLSSKDGL